MLRRRDLDARESSGMKEEEEETEEEMEEEFDPDEYISQVIVAHASAANNEQVRVQDEVSRTTFRVGHTTVMRRDRWKVSVFNLDMSLLGNFSKYSDLVVYLASNTLYAATDQLEHSQHVRVSVGAAGGRRREMFIFTRLVPGATLGLTELGVEVFNSNEVKYPNGVAIEDSNGRFLAGCSSCKKAADLLGISRGHPNKALRNSSNGTAVVGDFKVRYLRNNDSFGVTQRGMAVLSGWTNDWED